MSKIYNGNTWINKDEITSGNWSISKASENNLLEFHEDFITPDGPDLKLYLSKKDMNAIGVNEAINSSGLYIDELNAVNGKQQYVLPNSEKLSAYKSLVILCEKYTVVWGGFNFK